MRSAVRKVVVPLAVTAMAAFGLAACGGDDDTEAEETPTSEETPTVEEPEPEETEDAPTGEGTPAPWANPITTEGELIATFEAGDFTIEAYQSGVDTANRSSMLVDPDTEEPVIQEGDEVVVLNYVVTNNGDPVNLNYGVDSSVRLKYDSWPYLQSPSVSDSDLFEQFGVNSNPIAPGNTDLDAFPLGTGEQIAFGEILLYQPGEAYTLDADFTLVDDSGERTGDSYEGEETGVLE